MENKIYTVLLASVIIFTVGCKSASKLYNKGNYDEAVTLAVKKLQKKPNDGELKAILQSAYHYAVEDHEKSIHDQSIISDELKWERIYNEYVSLQRLYNDVHSVPELNDVINPTDYSSYLVTYKEKAGDVRYERALRWMENDDKQSFRNAYREFQAALCFKPNDWNIQEKMKEAYDAAVIRVLVMPVERYGYMNSSYQIRNFENDIIRNLQYNTNNEFVKYYSRGEAQNIEPDQVIEMRFNNLDIGRIRNERNSRQVSKEVVVRETVYRPDSIVKEYARVQATITTTRRTMQSEGTLSINIRDSRGGWLWNDYFRGDHQWATEFASYTGDERALSAEDKQLISRREQNPPDEDDIIREITNEIDNNLFYRIRDFYNRY
jgi:hypothetical protein